MHPLLSWRDEWPNDQWDAAEHCGKTGSHLREPAGNLRLPQEVGHILISSSSFCFTFGKVTDWNCMKKVLDFLKFTLSWKKSVIASQFMEWFSQIWNVAARFCRSLYLIILTVTFLLVDWPMTYLFQYLPAWVGEIWDVAWRCRPLLCDVGGTFLSIRAILQEQAGQ